MYFYNGKYDRIFKKIFLNNKDLLKELLYSLLKIKFNNIKILNNELEIYKAEEKVKTVDMLINADNYLILIELNTSINNNIRFRNYVFFSQAIFKSIKRGRIYNTDTKYILINLNYNTPKKSKEVIEYNISSKDNISYINNVIIRDYSIDKIMEYWYIKDEEKIKEYKEIITINLNKEELIKIVRKEDEIMRKYTEMEKYAKIVLGANYNPDEEPFEFEITPEEDREYMENTIKVQAYMNGEKNGIRKGITQGRTEQNISIAANMLKEKFPIDIISKLTGLSKSKIKSISL